MLSLNIYSAVIIFIFLHNHSNSNNVVALLLSLINADNDLASKMSPLSLTLHKSPGRVIWLIQSCTILLLLIVIIHLTSSNRVLKNGCFSIILQQNLDTWCQLDQGPCVNGTSAQGGLSPGISYWCLQEPQLNMHGFIL